MTRKSIMRGRAGWILLIAVVLMMRAMVPQGWMPDSNAQSLFAFKPCPEVIVAPESPVQMSAHHDHMDMADAGEHGGHSEHFSHEPCAFSGFGMPGLTGDDFAVLSVPLQQAQVYDRAQADAITLARQRTLPPARGPPLPV